jgi:polyhydroxyalkanoate synthesis regulator protein
MIQITRYSNRKLYSKTDSTYLTLEALRDKIKTGATVKVTDHKTGTDITAKVLAATVTTLNLEVAQLQKLIKGELQ